MKNINLNLAEINEGAMQEQFDHEMEQVMENILDLNTDPTKKRLVTLTVEVVADKNRELLTMVCKSKSKLVPRDESETKVLFGRNIDTGHIEANELKSGARGQMYMDPEDLQVKTDTGESVEEIEQQEQAKKEIEVIDFRQKATNSKF
ncbi:hypothetical protein [Enterococcus faecalis]|uniref:hypothetical protein n=1 Tax=Enterococcus faecalis TaxID=1351 RepID=UPI0040436BA4